MRHIHAQIEKRPLRNLVPLALVGSLFAGCSADVARLTDPIYTGSTSNQQQIIGGQPAGDLNPYPPAAARSTALPPAGTPVASQAQPPYQPPKPYAAAGMTAPVGPVAQPAYPQAQAQPAQLVAAAPRAPASGSIINDRAPRDLDQQAAALKKPAPAVATGATVPAGGAYKVRSGDTLYSIARRHGVSTGQLMAANGLSGSAIRSGQTLTIPGAGSPAAAPPTVVVKKEKPREPAPTKVAMIRPAEPKAAAAPETYTPPKRDEVAAAPKVESPAAKAAGFRWPVRGRIISDYGKKPNGERNDGINIAVPAGVAVKAADDGVVIYSGSELKSYGNLVLVKHADGWVTAYGHNSKNLVKRGDTVRRGQTIAETGMSGGAATPQLHFEVRKGANPVNPLKHLADA